MVPYMDQETLLTAEDLARELQVSTHTLDSWRRNNANSGPAYILVGRSIRYRRVDVDQWLESRKQASK